MRSREDIEVGDFVRMKLTTISILSIQIQTKEDARLA